MRLTRGIRAGREQPVNALPRGRREEQRRAAVLVGRVDARPSSLQQRRHFLAVAPRRRGAQRRVVSIARGASIDIANDAAPGVPRGVVRRGGHDEGARPPPSGVAGTFVDVGAACVALREVEREALEVERARRRGRPIGIIGAARREPGRALGAAADRHRRAEAEARRPRAAARRAALARVARAAADPDEQPVVAPVAADRADVARERRGPQHGRRAAEDRAARGGERVLEAPVRGELGAGLAPRHRLQHHVALDAAVEL